MFYEYNHFDKNAPQCRYDNAVVQDSYKFDIDTGAGSTRLVQITFLKIEDNQYWIGKTVTVPSQISGKTGKTDVIVTEYLKGGEHGHPVSYKGANLKFYEEQWSSRLKEQWSSRGR